MNYWEQAKKKRRAEAEHNRRQNEKPETKRARLDDKKARTAEGRSKEEPDAKKARWQKEKEERSTRLANGVNCHKGFENCARMGVVTGPIQPLDLGQMDARCVDCEAWMFPWETSKPKKEGGRTFSLCSSYGK